MKIQAPKKLIAEDFTQEDRDLVSRLGSVLNNYLDEVYLAISKKLNVTDNLNQEIKTIKVTTSNVNGDLSSPVKFKNNLGTKLNGVVVIRALGDVYPDSQPFISFSESNFVVTVQNVKGLPINEEFQLVILTIGD